MNESSETLAVPAPVVSPAPAGRLSRAALAALVAGLALVAVGLFLVPREATLGGNVRMVFFHGAVTWNGILMAIAAGAAGVYTILSSREPAFGARRAEPFSSPSGPTDGLPSFVREKVLWRLLSLATAFWVFSLTLSFPVMIRTWGGVLWNEPRLLMSAELVSLLLICWAVSFFLGTPRVTAVAALVASGVMVALLSTTQGAFHPDNPIMGSGNPRFIGTFVAILAGLVITSLGLAFMRRVAPGHAP